MADQRPASSASSIPPCIARLGSLELKARTIVEGFLSGLHRSPFKGFSVEFAEYRPVPAGRRSLDARLEGVRAHATGTT